MDNDNKENAPAPVSDAASTKTKKKSGGKKVLIILGILVLLIGGGILVAILALKNNDAEVQSFLSAVYDKDYTTAYDNFSPELKQVQSFNVFERGIGTMKLDSSCKTEWTTNSISVSTSDGSRKEIGGTITCDGGTYKAEFKLTKQDDGYKFYSYYIRP